MYGLRLTVKKNEQSIHEHSVRTFLDKLDSIFLEKFEWIAHVWITLDGLNKK